MLEAVVTVLRALIDAAFSSGGITDLQHTALHGALDAAAAPEPEPEPTPALPAEETQPYV